MESWYQRNRSKVIADALKWYRANREHAKDRILKRYHSRPDVREKAKLAAKQRRATLGRNKTPREKIDNLHIHKKAWRELRDWKVKQYLKYRFNIEQPTQEEIEQCKRRIQSRRAATLFRHLASAQQLSQALRS